MKLRLGTVPLVYPIPIVLAGANVDGKPNYATLGDCGVMGINPPLVYVSLGERHYTTQGIVENGTFSVNFPSTDMLAVTDYCGIASGRFISTRTTWSSEGTNEVVYGSYPSASILSGTMISFNSTRNGFTGIGASLK